MPQNCNMALGEKEGHGVAEQEKANEEKKDGPQSIPPVLQL